MFGFGDVLGGFGDIAPSQVIPAGFITPTPDNPLGIPGLGGTLVIPQLPSIPGVTPPAPQPAQPLPGGGTDPNNPKIGPLFGPPATPQQGAGFSSVTSSPLAMIALGGLAVFFLLKVLK